MVLGDIGLYHTRMKVKVNKAFWMQGAELPWQAVPPSKRHRHGQSIAQECPVGPSANPQAPVWAFIVIIIIIIIIIMIIVINSLASTPWPEFVGIYV